MSILRSRVTTSSFSRTASGKLAVVAVVRQQVFAEAHPPSRPAMPRPCSLLAGHTGCRRRLALHAALVGGVYKCPSCR